MRFPLWFAILFTLLFAVLPSQDARADACNLGNDLQGTMINGLGGNCGQTWSGSVSNSLLGAWGSAVGIGRDRYSACGNSTNYNQGQDVWLLGCLSELDVRVEIFNLQCNIDMFVLENSCDGSTGPCAGSSTKSGRNPDDVLFRCRPGRTYYISLERNERSASFFDIILDIFRSCGIYSSFPYQIRMSCFENCENGIDDNGNGLTDCQDPSCPVCVEICNDGIDNNFNGLIDCEDPECKDEPFCCDVDGDGYAAMGPICGGTDCNDRDPNINPGAVEIPADGVDQNCDGFEDCYVDGDGDRFGIPTLTRSTFFFCIADGVADNPDDCDDTDPNVYPGAPEIVANGKDDNCDGFELCYVDNDQDGFGTLETDLSTDWSCTSPGFSTRSDDCDDNDPLVYPGATEIPVSGKDENCDGFELCYEDKDGDGFGVNDLVLSTDWDCIASGVSPVNTDCDDANATIFPGATELVADQIDQNCDGFELCWLDNDRDGFGNMDGLTILSPALDCSTDRASLTADDCDDNNPNIYPGAPRNPGDGIDWDCSGLIDCFVDNDGDGYGSTMIQSAIPGCAAAGLSRRGGDCDDDNPAINPGADELPADGVDQNCDGIELCYRDSDRDTFGRDEFRNSEVGDLDCQGDGVSDNNLDCNDDPPLGASIYPGAPEIPNNGIDEDCDGFEICFQDNDNDTYGSTLHRKSASLDCIAAGVANNDLDCDDTNPRINPSATEIPANGIDDNCDGFEICYFDNDNDLFGSTQEVRTTDFTCGRNDPTNQLAANNTDCDDNNPLVYPGAPIPPNPVPGVNYNCSDGAGNYTCFVDNDGDGFGSNITIQWNNPECSGPGVADNNLDCNDNDPNIYPGAPEIPNNGIDESCDGFELCYQDLDGDGFGSTVLVPHPMPTNCIGFGVANNADDCNDNPEEDGHLIYPGAFEIPANGVDNNCNGLEACYRDDDFDTFGAPDKPVDEINDLTCTKVLGYADNNLDCDDANPDIYPGATEIIADGVDQNCDGMDMCFVDEDGDGWGIAQLITGSLARRCVEPGRAPRSGDCYDVPPEGALIYPGSPHDVPGSGIDYNCNGFVTCYRDADGDGWGSSITVQSSNFDCIGPNISPKTGDCDDSDPSINPGATDIPASGVDQNCDGMYACYLDQDRDGFGVDVVVASHAADCIADGVSPNNLDCNDVPPLGAQIYPGAPEQPGTGIDYNCNGRTLCYLDNDRDGYGSNVTVSSTSPDCSAPGVSSNNLDCDDFNANINPSATDIPASGVDENCDGLFACFQDNDGDGFGTTAVRNSVHQDCVGPLVSPRNDDCNDVPPEGAFIFPGSPHDVPGSGIDYTCNGLYSCFRDDDGDGFGDASKPFIETPIPSCEAPNASPIDGDCDDSDPNVYPGAPEIPADGIDQNCSGGDTCFRDRDLDGYGTPETIPSPDLTCVHPGMSSRDDDCVDQGMVNFVLAENINPGAIEVCNGVDDNCNGLIDDADPSVQANRYWYNDMDGDGYGTTASEVVQCSPPDGGWADAPGDCDDNNPLVNPGMDELCDPFNVDEDCNGFANNDDVDPNDPRRLNAIDAVRVYPDMDDDGWGVDDPTQWFETCTPGDQNATRMGDCDDNNPLVNPGMPEIVYDGFDNDCDPNTPDDDLDEDGFCRFPNACPGAPAGRDCNDTPAAGPNVNPAATEIACNGIDDNCSGIVDEGTACWDDDGDGFTPQAGDCNDTNPNIYPGATEVPNNLDDNCNGIIDENTIRYDNDGDGYCASNSGCVSGFMPGDCNDGDPRVNPGMPEIMGDGIDNNCDGRVDGGSLDPDRDGYAVEGGDCVEGDPRIFPGARERPNNLDDNCNGIIDEGTVLYDDDGDGYCEGPQPCTDGSLPGDCNDYNELIHPGAVEDPMNGIDDNCNGVIDEGGPKVDGDGDGFAIIEGDCDDNDPLIYPGAPERPNGKDDNCNGVIDEGLYDIDQDGFTVEDGDCDDRNGWVNPEQPEVCDGVDNNCDGFVDQTPDGESVCPDVSAFGGRGSQGDRGCHTASASPLPWVGALTLLTLLGRRRRQHPPVG